MQRRYLGFGEYKFDTSIPVLYLRDNVVDLQPKALQVLGELLKHAGSTVSKEQLLETVWHGVVVEEDRVKRIISVLRSTLGDEEPYKYIRTVRSSGYQFCLPVTEIIEDAPTDIRATQETHESAARPLQSSPRRKRPITAWIIAALLLIAASSFFLKDIFRSALKHDDYVIKQLTSNARELPISEATLSPDGSKILFIETGAVYVADADIRTRYNVALPPNSIPLSIYWFPDNIHALLRTYNTATQSGNLWKLSTLGEELVQLPGEATSAAVSPDGKHLLLLRNDDRDLWLTDTDGGNAKLMEPRDLRGQNRYSPIFSDDGKYIVQALIDPQTRKSRIYAYPLNNEKNDEKPILLYETSALIDAFQLLKNNELWFSEGAFGDAPTGRLITTKINFLTKSHSTPRKIMSAANKRLMFNAASNGNNVFVILYEYQSDAFVAELDANHAISSTRRITLNDANDLPASWLDNETILFSSNREGPYKVFKQNIHVVDASRLVSDTRYSYQPNVPLDGQWLLYLAKNAPNSYDLMRLSLASGTTTKIDTSDDAHRSMRCAKASMRCVLAEHKEDQCIYFDFDPARGRGKELIRVPWKANYTTYDWDISSDGSKIAFIDSFNGSPKIGIIDISGAPGAVQRIPVGTKDPLQNLAWASDGSGFYLTSYDVGSLIYSLKYMNKSGAPVTLLQESVSGGIGAGWIIPSPDGKHLLMHKHIFKSNLWMVTRK